MQYSDFAKHYQKDSGIFILMKDLDEALNLNPNLFMLGGGNPGFIPEMQEYFYSLYRELEANQKTFFEMIGIYDSPLGNQQFREELAEFFKLYFGWNLSKENIAITMGSQNAFYILFNFFSGYNSNIKKSLKVFFPITPEYIGYEDIPLQKNHSISLLGIPEIINDNFFRYHLDRDKIRNTLENLHQEIGCMAISNPTNPTGRIFSYQELLFLKECAEKYQIPVIIDCAYGAPFPNIIYKQQTFVYSDFFIYSFSLSKSGLPGLRTGILVGNQEIIRLVGKVQSIHFLSPNRIAPYLLKNQFRNFEFIHQCRNSITPYYLKKRNLAIELFLNAFNKKQILIHESEGAFFLWLVFPTLKIETKDLYEILKKKNVIVVPGNYYYPNLSEQNKNSPFYEGNKSIRLSFSQSDEQIKKGIEILIDTVKEYI
ncbi:MAG: aminotransferase class I/II-fold pyridoxal phosphate-dependent enzyme [Leptonema sp. (in: bacteria)]